MQRSKCERPPGRDSAPDGLNAMPCLAAGVTEYTYPADCEQAHFVSQRLPADRDAGHWDFSEIKAEHSLCALPSDDVLRGLAAAGVDLAALIRRWQSRTLDVPRIDRVVFDGCGGFEFARYRNGIPDSGAMIFIVKDHIGDVIDLAAWAPPRPLALWMARGALLGSENLFGFRMREALEVHSTPLDWLRSACNGVVILNAAKAASLLRRAEPLQASSLTHERVLRRLLEVKSPRILVPASAARRAT
jgi:hypothetical protein